MMSKKELHLANRTITTNRAAFVMGIVNCTPDSFFSDSRGGVKRAMQLVEEGADILDIGGESTRPGASYIDEEEELRRVIPVVRSVRKVCSIPISIDTRKSAVFRAALDEGADILNDVSALEDDERMGALVASSGVPVILMHKKGVPATMQQHTHYEDVFTAVELHLEHRIKYALNCGVAKDKIIVDPGIGFGKDAAAAGVLVRQAGELCGGEYPVLIGLSRKSCIGEVTGREVGERLAGSVAGICAAAMNGAAIVRVHDVAQSVDAMKVVAFFGC